MMNDGLLAIDEVGLVRTKVVLTGCEGCAYDTFKFVGSKIDGELIVCKHDNPKDDMSCHTKHKKQYEMKKKRKEHSTAKGYEYEGKRYSGADIATMFGVSLYQIKRYDFRRANGVKKLKTKRDKWKKERKRAEENR